MTAGIAKWVAALSLTMIGFAVVESLERFDVGAVLAAFGYIGAITYNQKLVKWAMIFIPFSFVFDIIYLGLYGCVFSSGGSDEYCDNFFYHKTFRQTEQFVFVMTIFCLPVKLFAFIAAFKLFRDLPPYTPPARTSGRSAYSEQKDEHEGGEEPASTADATAV